MPSAEAGEAPTHDGPGRDFPLGDSRVHLPGPPPRRAARGPRSRVSRGARPRGCGPGGAARGVPRRPRVARSPGPLTPARRGGAAVSPLRGPPLRNRGRVAGAGSERRARRPCSSDSGATSCSAGPSGPSSPKSSPPSTSLRAAARAIERELFPGAAVGKRPRARHLAGRRRAARARERVSCRAPPEEGPRGRRRGPRAGAPSSPAERGLRKPRACPAPPARRIRELLAFLESLLEHVRALVPSPHGARRPAPRDRRTGSPSICRRPSTTTHLVETERPNAELPEERVGPLVPTAPTRGLHADRPAHDAPGGPRRDALLPPLPRAREGLLLEGLLRRRRPAPSRRTRSASPCTGCPLDEKISEMHAAAPRGRLDRRARPGLRRQPDVPRHGPPHLQRLHEGLHLPEAGAGQHPADRDGRR